MPIVLAALCTSGVAEASGEHDYVGAAKCRTCHKKELMGNQYGVWEGGPHVGAYETLKSEESQALAKERGIEGPAEEAAECLSCHLTGHGVAAERLAYPLDPAHGVQCESCHGPGRDYRKKTIMADREKAIAKGLWDVGAEEERCTVCHNPESPTFDPKRYTLPDGTHSGFDFEQAKTRIDHPIPEHVKGNFIELDKKAKAEERARKKAGQ